MEELHSLAKALLNQLGPSVTLGLLLILLVVVIYMFFKLLLNTSEAIRFKQKRHRFYQSLFSKTENNKSVENHPNSPDDQI